MTKPKICKEFQAIGLGDARLNQRLLSIVRELNANPSAPTINATFENWSDTKATYNFFANENVIASKLIAPHIEQTKERLKKFEFAYAVSDTTFVNYHGHPKTVGLGSIGRYNSNSKHSQGIIVHVTYAISPSGLPLGILAFEAWVRPPNGYNERRNENNESDRWLRQFELAAKLFPKTTKMIYLADRESDLYEIFEAAQKLGVDVVIRSKQDRRIKGDGMHITDAQDKAQIVGEVTIQVGRKKGGYRKARLQIKHTEVKIQRPGDVNTAAEKRQYITLTLVSAEEVDAPEGEDKLYWRLLTALPVSSLEDCLKIIEHYKNRWGVELLFKSLKSGCTIESCRLQHRENLIRYIAVMIVVAWKIAWKVHVNRVNPKGPWYLVLTMLEYKILWLVSNKKEVRMGTLARDPPESDSDAWTVRDAVRAIAKRAGFNARKRDGEPGMQKIWEGWVRLQSMVELGEVVF